MGIQEQTVEAAAQEQAVAVVTQSWGVKSKKLGLETEFLGLPGYVDEQRLAILSAKIEMVFGLAEGAIEIASESLQTIRDLANGLRFVHNITSF